MTEWMSAQKEFHCMEFLYYRIYSLSDSIGLGSCFFLALYFVSLRQEKKFNQCEAVQNVGGLSAFFGLIA
jgi:hypothetical protein